MDLDEMICRSICSVESADTRKKLASQIILVGGVAKTDKLVERLVQEVENRFQEPHFDDSIENIEVLLVNLQQYPQVVM